MKTIIIMAATIAIVASFEKLPPPTGTYNSPDTTIENAPIN